jgi:hypothetical protein
MANERLDIARFGIGKLIKDGGLCVPPNQREYAWREEHVSDLYQDLAKAISDGEPDYFLGSIVVAKKNGSLEVFDGQQRLATTVILLAAIRDYYRATKDEKRANIIHPEYLMSPDLRTLEEQPNLTLSKSDHDFYLKRVLADDPKVRTAAKPSRESHERIDAAARRAAKHVGDIVASLPESAKSQELYKWVTFLVEGAMVICVQVADDRSAYIVFETMNDRGLRPSAADLLKNHLFGLADNRMVEAEHSWIAMTGTLETVPEADDDIVVTYIRHLWISQHGPTRTKDLFDRIKTEIKSKQSAIDLASELAANAVLYAGLLNPAHEMWNPYGPSAKKYIDTLRSLGMEQLRPLLLSGLKRFPQGEIPRFLLTVLCWAVRFLVAGSAGSGALEGNYGRSALEVHKSVIKNTNDLVSAMVGIVPPDDAFRSSFSVVRVAKAHLARYYLRALQMKDDGESEPQYVPNDSGEVNLEHILPQSPSAEWKVDADMLRANFQRLGNLVLLQASENTLVGNSKFDDKKAVLSKSAFSLTREVAQCAKWDAEEINKRQAQLADLAVATWPLKP